MLYLSSFTMNVYVTLLVVFLCNLVSHALPLKDSPISTFVVPYEPYASQQIINSRGQLKRVLVPLRMEIVPRANPNRAELAMGSKGTSLNFAKGAYPVYYMIGSANGKFNGKITLLK